MATVTRPNAWQSLRTTAQREKWEEDGAWLGWVQRTIAFAITWTAAGAFFSLGYKVLQ